MNKPQLPEDFLPFGRMLSGSKSGYSQRFPNNRPVFNANVCTKEDGKIWYGDLDLALERDATALQNLANTLGRDVYVLSEHDARFQYEDAPQYDRAVQVFTPIVP